mmetsp:Transcript_11624/g.8113  ORF Transcript_11624/g.8113 Transcript_11624/m.8113 type:complete len:228 (-) Transcript_11624:405-1088(-)
MGHHGTAHRKARVHSVRGHAHHRLLGSGVRLPHLGRVRKRRKLHRSRLEDRVEACEGSAHLLLLELGLDTVVLAVETVKTVHAAVVLRRYEDHGTPGWHLALGLGGRREVLHRLAQAAHAARVKRTWALLLAVLRERVEARDDAEEFRDAVALDAVHAERLSRESEEEQRDPREAPRYEEVVPLVPLEHPVVLGAVLDGLAEVSVPLAPRSVRDRDQHRRDGREDVR